MRISIFYHLLVIFLMFSQFPVNSFAETHSYIVLLGEEITDVLSVLGNVQAVMKSHLDLLSSIFPSFQKVEDMLLYSYSHIVNGFAIILDDKQAELVAKHVGVLSIVRNSRRKMDTTHSWQFLGLENNNNVLEKDGFKDLTSTLMGQRNNDSSLWEKAKYGEDVIIGCLDSGVWPESPSFNDVGYGPIPTKWHGICQPDGNVLCNRKLIGARFFYKGYEAEVGRLNKSMLTARDMDGHGTHTLSTAGGNIVNANVFGLGDATAKGGAPRARVAAYKVCWPAINDIGGCFEADILAAFDAAMADGVDVISMSIGGFVNETYAVATALGSYYAASKGIVVVASAGNDGPDSGTVQNIAPWVITVGASTTDRDFSSYVTLGNNKTIKGTSLSDKALQADKFYPVIRGADARTDGAVPSDGDLCKPGALNPIKVKGKILVCLRGEIARVEKGYQAALAGAVAMILVNDEQNGDKLLSEPYTLPASHITFADGQLVYDYLTSTKNAIARISPVKIELGTEPAPMMASFTSRGPNPFEQAILKPDITAPGVDIIAAYPQNLAASELESDTRRVPFNVMSGTSMSCPHIAGIAALLKAVHPNWSPAAIKSALMTTATTLDMNNRPILDSMRTPATPFAYGAGHVRPTLAVDPGLVYDLSPADYTQLGCAHNSYPLLTRKSSNAPLTRPCGTAFNVINYNYPTITVPNVNAFTRISRKVKNVGNPTTYTAHVEPPSGMLVTVQPRSLTFKRVDEEQTFTVSFTPMVRGLPKNYVFGRLVWSDGTHNVTSLLVVKHA